MTDPYAPTVCPWCAQGRCEQCRPTDWPWLCECNGVPMLPPHIESRDRR